MEELIYEEGTEEILIEIERLQSYLKNTDWYSIRFAETGKSIPEDIKRNRQIARDRISELGLS